MRHHRASLLALLLLAAAAPSAPEDARQDARQDARRQAQAAEAARAAALAARDVAAERARDAAKAEAALASERIKATARLRVAEAATLQAAERMDALGREQRNAERRLADGAAAVGPLLPLIERLALYPGETLLAVPGSREDAVRGLLVLRFMTHRLEDRAVELRREQDALRAARAATAAEAPRLHEAETAQLAAAHDLDREIAATEQARLDASTESAADARRAEEMAARASTLRGLIAKLEQARAAAERSTRRSRRKRRPEPAPEAEPVASSAPAASSGPLLVPVAGTLVRSWGQPTEAGPASGSSYRAAPNARVLAPCGGTVAFAAPFRSYGKLIIIACGGGTDVVLAGLDKFDVRPGEKLRRGEPVGTMPGWTPSTGGERPTLYVELRRHGEPVNPTPLMAAS